MTYVLTDEQKADWEVEKLKVLGSMFSATEILVSRTPLHSDVLVTLESKKIAHYRKCFKQSGFSS